MSVDNLPPDIGAMLRNLRSRVWELERRRQPKASSLGRGATYRWGEASAAALISTGSGAPFYPSVAHWEFKTPIPAYVFAVCSLYAVNALSANGHWEIGLELRLNGATHSFTDSLRDVAVIGDEVPMTIQEHGAVAAGGPHSLDLHAQTLGGPGVTGHTNLNAVVALITLFPIDPDALDMSD